MNTKQIFKLTLCLILIPAATQLASAQKPELVVQTGHSDSVHSVAFSPDGKTLASGSEDHTVKLWDVATGAQLRSLDTQSGPVNSVVFSPDGKTLASGSDVVQLWDVATGAQLRSLHPSAPLWRESPVNSVVFSPDGKTFASGSALVELWDVATGVQVRRLDPHPHYGSVNSIAFSPDGKTMATGGDDWAVQLFDDAMRRRLDGHRGPVLSVTFSPDSKMLASGGEGTTVLLWDVTTGTQLRSLAGHNGWVRSVAFSPDGKLLASSSYGMIKLWDVGTCSQLRSLNGHSGWVNSVAFSPDGKTLASGGEGHDIGLWDVATGVLVRAFVGHNIGINSIAFSPDGKTLAGGDHTVNFWDLAKGAPPRSLNGYRDGVVSIAFSPDSRTLASSSHDKAIKLWDVATSKQLRSLEGHGGWVNSVAFSPDGKILASGRNDWAIKLWDVTTGGQLHSLRGHFDSVYAVAFSPDGRTLASGTHLDDAINLWEVVTGKRLRSLDGNSGLVTSLAFSPDGKTLASAERETIKLWDVATGKQQRSLEGHKDLVNSLAFSPDGQTLTSGGSDGTIKLWDVNSGKELRTLRGHSSSVTSVAFSADGKTLASGSMDGYLKLWRVADGSELASLVVLDEKDWIVVTPDGLFDGSPGAWNKISWRFNSNTFNHAPVEAFFSDYYYPGLLADTFAGKRPKAPSDISQKDRRQPQLKITLGDARLDATLSARDVTVKIDVSQAPAGAQDVRLFRNGSLVKVWHGDVLKGQSNVTLEATIPIVAGENTLTAYAFNHDNIKSSDVTLVVNGAESLKRQGTAYILAVGVNQYENARYNLKYAVADAQEFSTEVKARLDAQKRYAQVEVITLSDAEATKANIMQKLAQLVARVQPEDTVIVYFAGHGTAAQNRFYLIPHDLGYSGPRTALNEAGLQTMLTHSISDLELDQAFEKIDAGQLLLVIDACNSGQALEADEKRRGPMNSKGLAQLAYEKGMYVLTAAQSFQAAQEAAKFGHGFLTYALVDEGLKQGAADSDKNGRIDLREWLNYATDEVPHMQEANMLDTMRGRGRFIHFAGDGTAANDKNSVQRPRIFYRRELETNPLIVAILGSAAPQ